MQNDNTLTVQNKQLTPSGGFQMDKRQQQPQQKNPGQQQKNPGQPQKQQPAFPNKNNPQKKG